MPTNFDCVENHELKRVFKAQRGGIARSRFALCVTIFAAISLVTSLAIGQSGQAPTAASANAKVSRTQLQQDFVILRKALEEGHASLYRYTSKRDMDAAFEHALESIDHDMTNAEFYAIVTTLLDAIKCGHTQFVLPKESKAYLQETARQIPLKLRFISDKAYVLASADRQIVPGSELLSINGKPIGGIAKAIMRHLPGDGEIETGKYRALSAQFGWYYFLFVERPDSFAIEYLDSSGRTRKATLAALTAKDMQAVLEKSSPVPAANVDKPWLYEVMSSTPRAARLKLETFAPPDEGIDGQTFAQFLESSFKKVEDDRIEDLIIDIRGNDGGEDYGPLLYSYIAEGDFEVYASVDASTKKLPIISQYSKVNADFQTKFENQLVPSKDGRWEISRKSEYFLPTQQPRPGNYRKRVWVLTDGEVFSTGTVFCSLAKSHKRGIFVGEETGGAYQGFNAGDLVVITLPASQLRAVIPLLRFTIATGQVPYPSRGILPDHPVIPSIKDVLAGVDSELDIALKLISEKRPNSERQR
jgi:Peptidase family S41